MTALSLAVTRPSSPPLAGAAGNRRASRLGVVARDVGLLQVVVAAAMLLPLLVSLIYGEVYSALSFLVGSLLTASCGGLAYLACRDSGEPKRSDAMVIAGAGWLVTALFGSLPFLLAAYWTPAEVAQAFVPAGETYSSSLAHFRNPLHAFFESMSAYTTTGLTMAVHEPSIGYGLLFYRSLGQWIGGAGVIVLSLAIIPHPSAIGGLELYQSESAGIKLRPRILGTARTIWKVYAALTLLVACYLFFATLLVLPGYGLGASLFDALNHAMTGQSTGGFSTLDDSIAGYGSYAMDLVHVPPMVLGAISIPLYYTFLRKRELRVFWRDPQFRTMCVLLAAGIPLLVALLWRTAAVADPIREGAFQVVSGLSTTGWQTSDIGNWESPAVLLLAWGTMVVGGAAGATVGGVKLIRVFLLWQAGRWRLRKVSLPDDAVVPCRIGDRDLSERGFHEEVARAAVYCFFYLLLLTAAVIVVANQASSSFTLSDVLFECVSAQGTVGLSAGITDPGMPVLTELVFIVQMWVGRLEIFPVVVLLGTFASLARGRS
jgi:trk system potassium uptake protein TrkH